MEGTINNSFRNVFHFFGFVMKVGDLVAYDPDQPIPGALTAVKYHERMRKRTDGKIGIIIKLHGENVEVAFGNDIVIIRKNYLFVF